MFTSSGSGNWAVIIRDEYGLLANRYQNTHPKNRGSRAMRSGAIATFANLTPPDTGGRKSSRRGPDGLDIVRLYQ